MIPPVKSWETENSTHSISLHIIPETHVSRDPVRLKKIIDDFGGDMVVKPLQRYGGEGIIKVSTKDQENLLSLINYYVKAL